MGHTVHLFSPETWGFHIDLVTGNVIAPLSMRFGLRSLDPSQNNTLCIISFAFFYMTTRKEALFFPVCFFQVKPCSKIMFCSLLLCNIPFHYQTTKFPFEKVFSADKIETYVGVWQISKKHLLSLLACHH